MLQRIILNKPFSFSTFQASSLFSPFDLVCWLSPLLKKKKLHHTNTFIGILLKGFFSLLRQEYPILTSGEISHPGGWDKPIPEVIHLWRHSTSMLNNLQKSLIVCILDMFCTFLGKNEKNNQSPHWGRDSGIPSLCPIFATSTIRQASSWIANLGHSDGIPSSLPPSMTMWC